MEKTIAQQALAILKNIPSKNWGMGAYANKETKKCCAFGLINMTINKVTLDEIEANYNKFSYSIFQSEIQTTCIKFGVRLESVNDNKIMSSIMGSSDKEEVFEKYTNLKTPKLRVIALLKDMIKAGL